MSSRYSLALSTNWSDVPGIARACIPARWQDTWYRTIWIITLDRLIEICIIHFRLDLIRASPRRRSQKVIDDVTGEIVGYAIWELVDMPDDVWELAKTAPFSQAQKDTAREEYKVIEQSYPLDYHRDTDEAVTKMKARRVIPGPHMMLSLICVRPDHQRKGLATRLVNEGIKIANERCVKIGVIAEGDRVKGLCESLDFEVKDSHTQDLREQGVNTSYKIYVLTKSPDYEIISSRPRPT